MAQGGPGGWPYIYLLGNSERNFFLRHPVSFSSDSRSSKLFLHYKPYHKKKQMTGETYINLEKLRVERQDREERKAREEREEGEREKSKK